MQASTMPASTAEKTPRHSEKDATPTSKTYKSHMQKSEREKTKLPKYKDLPRAMSTFEKLKGNSGMAKQGTRSINSRIGRGVMCDPHGSTEVTTIESYDLTSAMELNYNSAYSKEIEDSEGIRVVGDS